MKFVKRVLSLMVIGVVGCASTARAQSVFVIDDILGTHYTATAWRGQEFSLATAGLGGQDGILSAVYLTLNVTNVIPGSLNVYLYTGIPSGTGLPNPSLQIGTIDYSTTGVLNLPVTLSGTAPTLLAGQDYTLVVNLTGGVTWQYATSTGGNTGNGLYGSAYNYNAGSWVGQAGQYRNMQIIEAAPEPGYGALVTVAVAGSLVFLKRRRRVPAKAADGNRPRF